MNIRRYKTLLVLIPAIVSYFVLYEVVDSLLNNGSYKLLTVVALLPTITLLLALVNWWLTKILKHVGLGFIYYFFFISSFCLSLAFLIPGIYILAGGDYDNIIGWFCTLQSIIVLSVILWWYYKYEYGKGGPFNKNDTMYFYANYVDIYNREIFPARIEVEAGIIRSVTKVDDLFDSYILPGFIDAHVHIESSLLIPSEFARMAVVHGTVATVSDPHEIANVCGMEGVEFMINNGRQVPFHFFFGAPSCVPATAFETAGDRLDVADVDALLARSEILYLAEMMNFPGVLHNDPEVMAKIASCKKYHKPVDGHAPGLMGDEAKRYIEAGMSTDHECFTIEEALDKLRYGMKVLIREGSAARNFDALIPLMKDHAANLMFCSDDKHPDNLLQGHINQLVARAIALGYSLFDVLQAACINPVAHYGLPVGTLREGDAADFIITRDLKDFIIDQTWIKGECVADAGKSLIKSVNVEPINQFGIGKKQVTDFNVEPKETEAVIECLDGQLITNKLLVQQSQLKTENDILKLVVVNRYHEAPVAIAYVKNFGLKQGAIASSVAHDSHNIIATGVDDASICDAVNLIIEHKGGLSAVNGTDHKILPLPVAGLMSAADAWQVADDYTSLHRFSIDVLGSTLRAPYMSLSFMALLVIPHLKLSDKGLFDGDKFAFV